MNKQFVIDGQVSALHGDVDCFFEDGPVGWHIIAGDGKIIHANQAELDLLGYSREDYEGRHIAEFHADPEIAKDILARLAQGEKLHCYPARLKARDGLIKHVQISSNGQFHDGEMIHNRCFTVDVTEAKHTEQAAAHLAAIVMSSNDAIISKTLAGTITSWNAAAERIFGYTAAEMIGQPVLRLIPPDRHGEEEQILTRLRAGERIEQYETIRRTKDGRSLDVSLTISPIKDARGRIIGVSKIAHDITERKRAEKTRELLIKELHHRINNTLANVQALAQHTLRRSASPSDFVTSFSRRLQALARVHSFLTSESWQSVSLKALIAGQLQLAPPDQEWLAVSGPDIALEPEMALHMAMLLHELYENAMKHGAYSAGKGCVGMVWRVKDRMLHLRWRERGGPAVTTPVKRGFGTILIEQSAKAYGGEARLSCAAHGLIWNIKMALPHPPRTKEVLCQTMPIIFEDEATASNG